MPKGYLLKENIYGKIDIDSSDKKINCGFNYDFFGNDPLVITTDASSIGGFVHEVFQ